MLQVEQAVRRLDSARVAKVDRWDVRGVLPEGRQQMTMANYMSIGVDAKAALLYARYDGEVGRHAVSCRFMPFHAVPYPPARHPPSPPPPTPTTATATFSPGC